MIAALLLGCAYATLLWIAARHTARSRSIMLGDWPCIGIFACGVIASVIASIAAPAIALLLASSVIGTIVCAIVDARTGLIFDRLTLLISLVAMILALHAHRLSDGLVAAAIIGGSLLGLYLVTGRRGIGLGDVKLGAALALGFGVQLAVVAIGCAFILGAAYALALIRLGRATRSDALRFGPFMAGGAAIGLTASVLGYHW